MTEETTLLSIKVMKVWLQRFVLRSENASLDSVMVKSCHKTVF